MYCWRVNRGSRVRRSWREEVAGEVGEGRSGEGVTGSGRLAAGSGLSWAGDEARGTAVGGEAWWRGVAAGAEDGDGSD